MAYIRVRPKNRKNKRPKTEPVVDRTDPTVAELFSFLDNPSAVKSSVDADIRALLNGRPLIPKFNENEPNLINTSPELMAEYKRQQTLVDGLKTLKRYKKNGSNSGYNYGFKEFLNKFDANTEFFHTVLVRVLSTFKPRIDDIYDNLKPFGDIEEIVINSDGNHFLTAFVRFESTDEAMDLVQNTNTIRFNYAIVSDVRVEIFGKPILCSNDGFETIAGVNPIDCKVLAEKVRSGQKFGKHFETMKDELLLTETDGQNRKQLVTKLELILNEWGFHCKFHVFGSSANDIGFRDSDIDIFLEIMAENNFSVKMGSDLATNLLEKIRNALKRRLNMYIQPLIPSRRCPLLRLDFRHFSDNLRSNGVICDLSLVNSLGLQNSKLIRFYAQLEPRFKTLVVVLRYLAKNKGFIGSSQMSSYAFSLLVVFFCQTRSPPLLPTVDQLIEWNTRSLVINGIECGFCDNVDDYRRHGLTTERNDSTVNQLLEQFFRFYNRFDFRSKVLLPRFGKTVDKSRYDLWLNLETNGDSYRLTEFVCIQDPFDLCFNPAHHMTYQLFIRLKSWFEKMDSESDQYFADNLVESPNRKTFADLLDSTKNLVFIDLDGDGDEEEEDEDLEVVGRYLSQNFIGKLVFNFDPKPSTLEFKTQLNELILKLMAFFQKVFKNGFRFKCYLSEYFGLKFGNNSRFANFVLQIKSTDKTVIDIWNREKAFDAIESNTIGLNSIQIESLITDRIIEYPDDYSVYKSLNNIDIELELSLESDYQICLNVLDVKPIDSIDGKVFIDFILETIRLHLEKEKILVLEDESDH